MRDADLYSVLGVLPTADSAVIRAAYKALAQRYHPDKWTGPIDEAHRRMAALNEAYRVLGDPDQRAAYDNKRRATAGNQSFGQEESMGEDFDAALADLEERWSVASSIYTDLPTIRARLKKISTALAFEYVATLLELKAYSARQAVASRLEQAFLERYFGTSPTILNYARDLIFAGRRDAVRALNRLVDVIGSDSDPDLLIRKIDHDFGLRTEREQADVAQRDRAKLERLRHCVGVMGYYDEARELCQLLGYQVEELGGSLWTAPQVQVTSRLGTVQLFKNSSAFINWARNELCR